MNGEIFTVALENSVENVYSEEQGKRNIITAQKCDFLFSKLSFLRVFQLQPSYAGQ